MRDTIASEASTVMPQQVSRSRRTVRKPHNRYHHGDLRRALLDEAVRTIREEGVEALTLRSAGARLGVSRTALYRHFADKSALLGAVATEGFRMLRITLSAAWTEGGGDGNAFAAMGEAYVRFAMDNPSHYRVMFGGFVDRESRDPELLTEAAGAFQLLVDALVSLQRQRQVRSDDPGQLARFVWATVHGVAMLAIDGQLQHQGARIDDDVAFAVERIRAAIARRS
jgi:AcrR family transcriptional regulator